MSDKTEPSPEVHDGGQAKPKSPYHPPRLTAYGSVSALTAGGSVGIFETVMNMMCQSNQTRRTSAICP